MVIAYLLLNTTGADITFMAIESVLYFLVVIFIEYCLVFPNFLSFFKFARDPPYEFTVDNEDEDVAAERIRVLSGNAMDDEVRIQELRKVTPENNRNVDNG